MMNGIDVSKWQGSKIDWAKVKAAGIDYAILRAGYGSYISQKDPTFERNYAECKRLGIPVGVYWYVYAKTLDGIKQEVKTLLEAIKGKQFEYPIYLDIENEAQASMTKAALTQMIETGCTALEQAGYFAGVYTYTSFASYMDYAGLAKKYTMWLADYRKNYNTTLTRDMHQYTSSGTVAGIGGRVDCNRAYVDFPALIKGAGKNGFEKEETNMDFVAVKNLMLEVTSAEKPACQAFSTPDVNDGNYRNLALGQYRITGVGPTVTLGGMQGTWYRIDLSGEDWYCLALPDRCKVVEVAEEPQPELDLTEVLEAVAALDKMLDDMDGKLDRVLEKLELVQQALEDPAAQQVLDKLEKAGAALAQ